MMDMDIETFIAGVLLITLGCSLVATQVALGALGIAAGGWMVYRSIAIIPPDGV